MFFYAQSYFKSHGCIYIWKDFQHTCPGIMCSNRRHKRGIQGHKMLPGALPNPKIPNLMFCIYKKHIRIYLYVKYILYADPATMHSASNTVTRKLCLRSATLDQAAAAWSFINNQFVQTAQRWSSAHTEAPHSILDFLQGTDSEASPSLYSWAVTGLWNVSESVQGHTVNLVPDWPGK